MKLNRLAALNEAESVDQITMITFKQAENYLAIERVPYTVSTKTVRHRCEQRKNVEEFLFSVH